MVNERPKRASTRKSYEEAPDDEDFTSDEYDPGRSLRHSKKRRRDMGGLSQPRKSRSGRTIRPPTYNNYDEDIDYHEPRSRPARPGRPRRTTRVAGVRYSDYVSGDDESRHSDSESGYDLQDEDEEDVHDEPTQRRKSSRIAAKSPLPGQHRDQLIHEEIKEESCKVRLPLKKANGADADESNTNGKVSGDGVIDLNGNGGDQEMIDADNQSNPEADKDNDSDEDVVRRSTRSRRQKLPLVEEEPIESGGDDQEFKVPPEQSEDDEEYNAERAEHAAEELEQPTSKYALRTRSAARSRPVEAQKGLRSSARLAKSTRQTRERRHIRKYPVRSRRPAKRFYVPRPANTARDSYRPKRSLRPADMYESSSSNPSSSSDDEHFGPARSPTGALPPNVAGGSLDTQAIDFLKNPMALTEEVGKTRPRSGRYGRRRGRAAKAGLDPFGNRAARIASKHPPIEPIKVDPNLSWDDVGGLDHHVRALKEMVFLPLVYPEVFEKFKITPPRGVLFYGPPGTGKTLCARTLAASCGGEPEPQSKQPEEAPQDPASKPSSSDKEKDGAPNAHTNSQKLPNGISAQESMKPDGFLVAGKATNLSISTAPNGSPPAMEIEVNGQSGGNTADTMQKDVVMEQAAAILAAATQNKSGKPQDDAEGKPPRRQRVAFFMRNGADCLSKWVGEAERQLRMTFEAAKRHQPAIIFFDEIDGLAPVRSSRQDQIHSSIVSTLLGLMDGLYGRGQIVVIGATNRVDAIDPALRRPGRFDRELIFTLPNGKARRRIMEIQTHNWQPKPPSAKVLDIIAERTVGYCGADLKALCTEAALRALRRRYPQIYQSLDKLLIDTNNVKVSTRDFLAAMSSIVPAAHRSARTHARPVPSRLRAVLRQPFEKCVDIIKRIFPQGVSPEYKKDKTPEEDDVNLSEEISDDDEDAGDDNEGSEGGKVLNESLGNQGREVFGQSCSTFQRPVVRPRLLISGNPGLGQTQLGPAILHYLEGCPVHSIDLPSLHMNSSARSSEEALVSAVREASRSAPSILYLPHLHLWWNTATESLKSTLMVALRDLPTDLPLLLLITSEGDVHELTEKLSMENVTLKPSKPEERVEMFEPLLAAATRAPQMTTKALRRKRRERYKPLPKAPLPQAKPVTKEESIKQMLEDDQYIRTLRMEMRAFAENLLRDRKYKVFHEAVDPTVAEDYYEIIKEPMDITKIAASIDKGSYPTVLAMVRDFDLMVKNAIQYNPAHTEEGAAILRRAHGLVDIVHAWADNLNPMLVEKCNRIVAKRIAKLTAEKEAEKARKEKEQEELIRAAARNNNDGDNINANGDPPAPQEKSQDGGDATVMEVEAAVVAQQKEAASSANSSTAVEAGRGENRATSNGMSEKAGGASSSEEEEVMAEAVDEAKVRHLKHLFEQVSTGVSVDGLERLHVKCASLLYEKRRERERNQVVDELKALLLQAREDPAIMANLVE